MTGDDDTVRNAAHDAAAELLPWYVTGQLAPDEAERVGDHVAGCAECQAEVAFQQRLEAEVARLPLDVERGWAAMRGRIEANDDTPLPAAPQTSRTAAWIGWGVAATFAVVAGASWLPQVSAQRAPTAEYAALGQAATGRSGNVVVVFHPDTTERQLRAVLKAGEARIVDGPTAAGGYVLRVPAARKDAALAALRAQDRVVLAEPIETGGAR
jgi:anti-sigma factor RsiW